MLHLSLVDFLCFEEVGLPYQLLCLGLLVSKPVSHGILPSKSMNNLKSTLQKARVVVLLLVLLASLRIFNFTVSCSLQLWLPLTFTFLTNSSLFVMGPEEHIPSSLITGHTYSSPSLSSSSVFTRLYSHSWYTHPCQCHCAHVNEQQRLIVQGPDKSQ